jgi:hypothetical protein
MSRTPLTPAQQADADRIHAALLQAAAGDLRELAELLAAQDDRTTFGATEFAVRDLALRVGAKAVEAALAGRKKGGTTAPPAPAPAVANPPSSSAGRPSAS